MIEQIKPFKVYQIKNGQFAVKLLEYEITESMILDDYYQVSDYHWVPKHACFNNPEEAINSSIKKTLKRINSINKELEKETRILEQLSELQVIKYESSL